MELTQLPIHLVPGFFLEAETVRGKSYESSASSVMMKNAWSKVSSVTYVLKVWCSGNHKGNFTSLDAYESLHSAY